MQPIGLAQSFLWFGIPSLILSRFILWWHPRGTTLLAYVCWKRKSTWPGIIAHFIQNGALPIMLAKGVMS
jgi:hypothetical protein